MRQVTCKYVLPSVCCLFILFMLSFAVQRCLVFGCIFHKGEEKKSLCTISHPENSLYWKEVLRA